MPVGAPPPPPSRVSLSALVVNVLLIVLAIAALIYLLQRFMFRFSLLTLFALMSVFPIYVGLGRLITMAAGYQLMRWYPIAAYFSPIAAVAVVRYSIHQHLMRILNHRMKTWPTNWASRLNRRSLDSYDNPHDAIATASRLDNTPRHYLNWMLIVIGDFATVPQDGGNRSLLLPDTVHVQPQPDRQNRSDDQSRTKAEAGQSSEADSFAGLIRIDHRFPWWSSVQCSSRLAVDENPR